MFKTVKTSELTGVALDWVVAKCEKVETTGQSLSIRNDPNGFWRYSPSTNPSQAYPIIFRERIAIDFDADPAEGGPCAASRRDDPCYWVGLTPLIAAMRCYVASKLGDSVEVPEELLKD